MTKKNRYPPDQWPDVELPLPRVQMWEYDLLHGGWLAARTGTLDFVTPPIEMHLREMREAPRGDAEALRELCEAIGSPVDYATPWRGVVSGAMYPHLAEGHARLQADNVGDQLDLPAATWDDRPVYAMHVREVALRVELVRLLVSHAELALRGAATAPLWQQSGWFDEDALSEHGERMSAALGERPLGDEDPETVAWARFAGLINDGLHEFTPRVRALNVESEPDTSDVTTAYGAACSMIFNDLRDRMPYKHCADETCGRLFKRQLGRSKGVNKPRTSGVEFCTWAHARNQSRRERRREARQED